MDVPASLLRMLRIPNALIHNSFSVVLQCLVPSEYRPTEPKVRGSNPLGDTYREPTKPQKDPWDFGKSQGSGTLLDGFVRTL